MHRFHCCPQLWARLGVYNGHTQGGKSCLLSDRFHGPVFGNSSVPVALRKRHIAPGIGEFWNGYSCFFRCSSPFAVTVATIVATPFERSPYLSQALVRVNLIINLSVTQVLASALHNALSPVYTGDS